MVDFRRVITVLAVLALFVGLAGAQSQETCSTQVTSSTPLRGEGFTELTGDIVVTCIGGVAPAPASAIPLVNFTVFYNTLVTSRLLPVPSGSVGQSSSNTSEALLLIDEPGSGLGTYGAGLNQTLCTTPLIGCQANVGTTGVTLGQAVTTTAGSTTPAPNVYQGVVNGNSVTFFGVPALPPTTAGTQRVYRITNVRVNAQPLAGGSASGASPVQASVVISGFASLPISNPAPIVGFVSNGLTASAGSASGKNQCSTQTKQTINTLTFTENFGTAFKTRVNASLASQNLSYYGQGNGTTPPPQNTPGGIYNSESDFVYPIVGNGSSGQVAGLADFGTRLKATFNNIPAGAHIFVSTVNVNNDAYYVPAPAIPGGSAANSNTAGTYIGYAQLISVGSSESISDGSNGGFANLVIPSTDTGPNGGNVPIAEVSISNGTGAAVWEVVNTNPNTTESFKFSVYISYTAAVATNSPLPGTSTVSLSFAPTATSGAASSSLPIPRFAGSSTAASNILIINICRTILLYPYITNQAGFDTGLTVGNTSQDPFTTGSNATGAQAGSCTLTWYGGTTAAPTTPPAPSNTGNIAAGTVWTNTLGTIAPNFQGYMFAVCNFQYAHGFAFISDVGARNLAMGYLAIVIEDPGSGARIASPPCQGISGCPGNGEQSAH
jgi:hypothetical protein